MKFHYVGPTHAVLSQDFSTDATIRQAIVPLVAGKKDELGAL